MLEPFAKIEPMANKRKSRRQNAAEFIEHLKQDNARFAGSSSRLQEIHVAEEFLKSLPELSYHVTKINQWGKHQSRLVRLTTEGIENIRTNVVSSMHQYGEVQSVSLRNLNTFVIQYLHADHDYVYRSPIAVQIVHEISTRVALRRTTDKKKSSYEHDSKSGKQSQSSPVQDRPSSVTTVPIPGTGSKTPSESGSFVSVSSDLSSRIWPSFSLAVITVSDLVDMRMKTHSSLYINLSSARSLGSSSVSSSASSTSSSPYTSPSPPSPLLGGLPDDASKRAAKLTKVLGTPQETRLHAEVDKLLWNEATPEGRTVSQFIADFYVLMKNPATCLQNVRRFLDSLRTHIIDKRGHTLIKLVVNAGTDLSPEETMSLIIEKSLEQAVIGRLHKSIYNTISTTFKISDEHLTSVTTQLKGKDQTFFGIPENLQSASGWSAARVELRMLSQSDTPSSKLGVILSTAKSIYSTANYEQTVLKKKSYVLSADDFLPIFMYVVAHAEVTGLETTNQFLWQLCDPHQLSGEGGYYLTVFSSILSLLHRVHLPALPTSVTLDDVIREEDELDPKDIVMVEGGASEEGGGGISGWAKKVQFWK